MQFTQSTNHATDEKLRLMNTQLVNNFVAMFATQLTDDFAFKVHDDLEYKKKDGTTSTYWGLVPFFNNAEHWEYAITQFDLLLDNCPEFDAEGHLKGFWTPNDALHTFARQTATADKTYKEWLQAIADKFKGNAFKAVALSFAAKNIKGAVYRRTIWGLETK